MKSRLLLWLSPLVALIALDLLLRAFGVGAPPAAYCPDGAPRGAARYEPRNVYLETRPDDASHFVVCFGDSWTWGVGVRAAETWPAKLETLLRRHDPEARVVNAAEPNATAADMARIFPRQTTRYRARQAVVFVGAQDAAPRKLLDKYPPGDPYQPRDCRRPWWRLGAAIGRRALLHKFRIEPLDPPESRTSVERRGTLAQAEMALLQIAETAHEQGVEVVFITYPALPTQSGAPHLPLENRYNFLIAAAAASFDAKVVDLESRWRNRTAEFLLPWMLWPQPNAAGCRDIAHAVAEML